MQVAIAAARRAEGRSGPNPPVGCAILSSDGQLIAVGHTASGGRPHAETEALAMAGDAAQGVRLLGRKDQQLKVHAWIPPVSLKQLTDFKPQ